MSEKRTDEELAQFLSRISYKSWSFLMEVRGKPDEGDVFIQPVFHAPDNVLMKAGVYKETPPAVLQKGRKWFLSRYSCDTEIVQTCWASVMRAELHEMQEQFLFDGVAVFNNHISVHALKEVADQVDQRD